MLCEAARPARKVTGPLPEADELGTSLPVTSRCLFLGSIDSDRRCGCQNKLDFAAIPAFSPSKTPRPTKFPGNIPECQNWADHLISKRNSRIPCLGQSEDACARQCEQPANKCSRTLVCSGHCKGCAISEAIMYGASHIEQSNTARVSVRCPLVRALHSGVSQHGSCGWSVSSDGSSRH